MTSEKQKKANIKNAQKSTGPITEEGKKVVSKNAIKHGILSKKVLLDSEDEEEYKQVRQGFIEDLNPVGAVEKMLVEKIINCFWRMQRVLTAEKGAIKNRTDNLVIKNALKRVNKADGFDEEPYLTDYKRDRLMNSVSCQRAIEVLTKLKKIVKKDGFLPDYEFKRYVKLTNLVADQDSYLWFKFINEIAQGNVEEEPKEKGKKALLMTIGQKIKQTKAAKEGIKAIEENEDKNEYLINQVPSELTIEKLSRYQTSLENSLYEALEKLIKIKTLKKGGKFFSAKAVEIEGIST